MNTSVTIVSYIHGLNGERQLTILSLADVNGTSPSSVRSGETVEKGPTSCFVIWWTQIYDNLADQVVLNCTMLFRLSRYGKLYFAINHKSTTCILSLL